MGIGYFLIKEGKYVYPDQRFEAERNVHVEGIRKKDCAYGDSVLVHPFLANVQTSHGPCGSALANSKSLIGKEFPDKPRPGTGIILMTGGSVATQLIWDNRKQDSYLERILNEQFTGERFERFVVLNGGHGAWKQPNQYILFGLYADVLDGIITLDGWNEHWSVGGPLRFEAPSNNFFHTVKRLDARGFMLSEAALRMEAGLYRFARDRWIFHHSTAAYLLLNGIRSWLRDYADGAATRTAHRDMDWVNASYETMFAFTDKMKDEERERWALDHYAKYIRLMHAGAKEMGIPSLFLIQPTPAIGKPLTERERPFATMTDKGKYERMIKHLSGLREDRHLPIYSLSDVFQNTEEDVYQDAIHVNELGNRLMAERVADLIEKVWGWPRRRPVHD
ncbi:MAG: hypothetical protein C4293_06215 [Nitrospiraceae bacterium]